MIASVQGGASEVNKPVTVFLSGNRPIEQVLSAPMVRAVLDGTNVGLMDSADDLDQGRPAERSGGEIRL